MTDPFDALRLPDTPVAPSPAFADRLRARLEDAVLAAPVTEPVGGPMPTLTPYLAVTDARAALDFYVEVFGATRRGDPVLMEDGRVGHAELAFGDSVLMLAEEFPSIGHIAPTTSHPSYRLELPNLDAAFGLAVARGATVIRPVGDTGHGRGGTLLDPFGHRWILAQAEPAHGELGYHTFQVPDADAAKEFYGAVLGWRFTPGRVENGWEIDGTGGMAGLWGGQGQVGWKPMYAVRDLEVALAAVRAHGGTAGEVERQSYGLSAECVDDQGIEFWLWQQ